MTYYILGIIFIVLIVGYYIYLHVDPIYSNKLQFRMVETDKYKIQFRNNKYCIWGYVCNFYDYLTFNSKYEVEQWIKNFYEVNNKIKNKKITNITVKIND